MARLLLLLLLSTALISSAWIQAEDARPVGAEPHASTTVYRPSRLRRKPLAKLARQDPVSLAKALAERYWKAVPCAGEITVLPDRPLVPGLDPTTDGWVTFSSSLGVNDLKAPPDTYSRCTISLAHWQWPTRRSMVGDWNMLCLTVIHEMGHLLGYPHSVSAGSVMSPVFTDEAAVPAICRAAGR